MLTEEEKQKRAKMSEVLEMLKNLTPEQQAEKPYKDFLEALKLPVPQKAVLYQTGEPRPGKMPPSSGIHGRIWDGKGATLTDHLEWFEREAEGAQLAPELWFRKWTQYLKVEVRRKVENLIVTSATHEGDWEAVKKELTEMYPDRTQAPGDVGDLLRVAEAWSKKDIKEMEDYAKFREDFAAAQARLMRDKVKVSYESLIDQYYFKGLGPKWHRRLMTDVQPEPVGMGRMDFEVGGFPPARRVDAQMRQYLNPHNLVERFVAEEEDPALRKERELAEEAEKEKDRWRRDALGKKGDESDEEGESRKKGGKGEEKKVPSAPASAVATAGSDVSKEKARVTIEEVDHLADMLGDLKVSAASLRGSAWDAANTRYEGYRERLIALRPTMRTSWPTALPRNVSTYEVEVLAAELSNLVFDGEAEEEGSAQAIVELMEAMTLEDKDGVQGIVKRMASLRAAHPFQWREQPEYATLVTKLESRCEGISNLLQKPLRPGERPTARRLPWNPPAGGGAGQSRYPPRAPGGAGGFPPRRSGCFFCGGENHFARECPNAKSYEPLIVLEGNAWLWAGSKPAEERRIARDRETNTYEPTVKAELERTKTVMAAATLHREGYYSWDQGMYNEGTSETMSCQVAEVPVVAEDGEVYTGPMWAPRTAVTRCRAVPVETMAGFLDEPSLEDVKRAVYNRLHGIDEEVDAMAATKTAKDSVKFQPYERPAGPNTRSKKEPEIAPYVPPPNDGRWVTKREQGKAAAAPSEAGKMKKIAPTTKAPVKADKKTEKKTKAEAKGPSTKKGTGKTGDSSKKVRGKRVKWSEMSLGVDASKTMKRIVGQEMVTLSIAELCTLSPSFQKMLREATKMQLKSVAVVNAAGADSSDEEEDSSSSDSESDSSSSASSSDESMDLEGLYGMSVDVFWEQDDMDIEVLEANVADDEGQEKRFKTYDDFKRGVRRPLITYRHGRLPRNSEDTCLSVGTSVILVRLQDFPLGALLDTGSQINVIPLQLWEDIAASKQVTLRRDLAWRIAGIHGKSERLMGYTTLRVEYGGLAFDHIFWVGDVSRTILGMPFIYKTRMNLEWSGDRMTAIMPTEDGDSRTYLHAPGGPPKAVVDENGNARMQRAVASVIDVSVVDVEMSFESSGAVVATRPAPSTPKRKEKKGCTCAPESPAADALKEAANVKMYSEMRQLAAEVVPLENRLRERVGEMYRAGEIKPTTEPIPVEDGEEVWEVTFSDVRSFEAMTHTMYKPAHKKKRPVEAVYPESMKTLMKEPENILGDLPSVNASDVPKWTDMAWGEKLTSERAAAALEGSKGF